MSIRTSLATLLLSATLAGAAAQAASQPAQGPTADVELTEAAPVEEEAGARTYLVIGLSTAAVVGLLLLIVLLARGTTTEIRQPHH